MTDPLPGLRPTSKGEVTWRRAVAAVALGFVLVSIGLAVNVASDVLEELELDLVGAEADVVGGYAAAFPQVRWGARCSQGENSVPECEVGFAIDLSSPLADVYRFAFEAQGAQVTVRDDGEVMALLPARLRDDGSMERLALQCRDMTAQDQEYVSFSSWFFSENRPDVPSDVDDHGSSLPRVLRLVARYGCRLVPPSGPEAPLLYARVSPAEP